MKARDYLMDANGARVVRNGDFVLAADAEAVPQGIRTRVRMFRGDYWLDEAIGLPWLQSIFRRGSNPLVNGEYVRAATAATPDVLSAKGGTFVLGTNRNATARCSVVTAYSTIPQQTTVSLVSP